MSKGASRFTPQHRFWNADLPSRETPVEGEAVLSSDLISMDETSLEVSRATNVLRGGALMAPLLMTGPLFFLCSVLATEVDRSLRREYLDIGGLLIDGGLLLFVLAASAPLMWWGIRLDTRMPRDTPIRFNRKTGKVQALEFKWTWNPFGQWPLQYKDFDWSNLQAEVQKQAGSDGRSYVIRYALVLCICKPGTFEVVDRVTLKSNRAGPEEFPQIWNYIRRFMLEGPAGLARVKPIPQGVSFRRSFFQYMRNLDPSQEGKDFRAESPWWLTVVNGLIVLVAFWIIIPMGLCHYIAMRFAPVAKWPTEFEAKSA